MQQLRRSLNNLIHRLSLSPSIGGPIDRAVYRDTTSSFDFSPDPRFPLFTAQARTHAKCWKNSLPFCRSLTLCFVSPHEVPRIEKILLTCAAKCLLVARLRLNVCVQKITHYYISYHALAPRWLELVRVWIFHLVAPSSHPAVRPTYPFVLHTVPFLNSIHCTLTTFTSLHCFIPSSFVPSMSVPCWAAHFRIGMTKCGNKSCFFSVVCKDTTICTIDEPWGHAWYLCFCWSELQGRL